MAKSIRHFRSGKPSWLVDREWAAKQEAKRIFATRRNPLSRLEQFALEQLAAQPSTPAYLNTDPEVQATLEFAGENPAAPASAVGGSPSPTTSAGQPWHLPRWLLYGSIGVGVIVLAVGGYVSATALPETAPEARTSPPAVATPFRQPTPIVSQYRKQALEEIAVIRQKEPGLADALVEVYVTHSINGYPMRGFSLKDLDSFRTTIAEGNYTLDTLVNSSNTTVILTKGAAEFRRNVITQIVKSSIPVMAEFLGVEYGRPLLVINVDDSTSKAGGGRIHIQATDWTLRTQTHELGHDVWEEGVSTGWLTEGVAEFAGIYAAENFAKANPQLITFWPNYEAGKLQVTQDTVSLDKTYQESDRGIKLRTSKGQHISDVDKGFVFLYEFRQLVGQEAFAEAMGHLRNEKVAREVGKVARRGSLTENDIETVLKQRVPQDKQAAFEQLYQKRVYDLQTTSP